jgi:hypothetical protein
VDGERVPDGAPDSLSVAPDLDRNARVEMIAMHVSRLVLRSEHLPPHNQQPAFGATRCASARTWAKRADHQGVSCGPVPGPHTGLVVCRICAGTTLVVCRGLSLAVSL